MYSKGLFVAATILVCGALTPLSAMDLGAGAGYGRFTVSAYGVSVNGDGISASLNADIPGSSSPVSASTSLSLWSGTFKVLYASASMTDITVAEALKVCLAKEEAPTIPYFGVQVAYHFLSSNVVESSESDFGIGAFGGVAFKVAPKVRIPVQLGYDHIFESGASGGLLAIRAGALFAL